MIEEIKSIQEQLAEIEEKRHALIQAQASKIAEAKSRALEDIAVTAEQYGITPDEIVAHFSPPKETTRRARSQSGPRCIYRDEEGREYRGGKPPAWMTQAMTEAGIETTREYCESRMSRVQ